MAQPYHGAYTGPSRASALPTASEMNRLYELMAAQRPEAAVRVTPVQQAVPAAAPVADLSWTGGWPVSTARTVADALPPVQGAPTQRQVDNAINNIVAGGVNSPMASQQLASLVNSISPVQQAASGQGDVDVNGQVRVGYTNIGPGGSVVRYPDNVPHILNGTVYSGVPISVQQIHDYANSMLPYIQAAANRWRTTQPAAATATTAAATTAAKTNAGGVGATAPARTTAPAVATAPARTTQPVAATVNIPDLLFNSVMPLARNPQAEPLSQRRDPYEMTGTIPEVDSFWQGVKSGWNGVKEALAPYVAPKELGTSDPWILGEASPDVQMSEEILGRATPEQTAEGLPTVADVASAIVGPQIAPMANAVGAYKALGGQLPTMADVASAIVGPQIAPMANAVGAYKALSGSAQPVQGSGPGWLQMMQDALTRFLPSSLGGGI